MNGKHHCNVSYKQPNKRRVTSECKTVLTFILQSLVSSCSYNRLTAINCIPSLLQRCIDNMDPFHVCFQLPLQCLLCIRQLVFHYYESKLMPISHITQPTIFGQSIGDILFSTNNDCEFMHTKLEQNMLHTK